MRLKATRLLVKEYEVTEKDYDNYQSADPEQICYIDQMAAQDDPELFFSDAQTDKIEVVLIKEV